MKRVRLPVVMAGVVRFGHWLEKLYHAERRSLLATFVMVMDFGPSLWQLLEEHSLIS